MLATLGAFLWLRGVGINSLQTLIPILDVAMHLRAWWDFLGFCITQCTYWRQL
jgi:hypothetical protein